MVRVVGLGSKPLGFGFSYLGVDFRGGGEMLGFDTDPSLSTNPRG